MLQSPTRDTTTTRCYPGLGPSQNSIWVKPSMTLIENSADLGFFPGGNLLTKNYVHKDGVGTPERRRFGGSCFFFLRLSSVSRTRHAGPPVVNLFELFQRCNLHAFPTPFSQTTTTSDRLNAYLSLFPAGSLLNRDSANY